MGGFIFPASGEIGSSFWEPPPGCLQPSPEPSFTHTPLEEGSAPLAGTDLGAGLKGGTRCRTVTTSRKGGTGCAGGILGRDFGASWAPSGAHAYLAPRVPLRSASGAGAEAGPWAGPRQGRGILGGCSERL